MDPRRFVSELEESLWQILSVKDAVLARVAQSVGRAEMKQLLRAALRNELEAAQIAAVWMPGTVDPEAKIAFARQAGDEARHYQLIVGRLGELGDDVSCWSPLLEGPSRLYRHLETLQATVERIGAAQFAREAIGYKANELFIAFCEASGDEPTARLYREQIQPDELRHHQWGAELLRRLARSDDEQAAVRRAVLSTLELAEELRSLAAGRLLVEALPGC
jgi:1,2-phenylacetyl-CoA epoxidase catalytic subunit